MHTRNSVNDEGILVSDNTYLLLLKYITKPVKTFSVETIEQLTTDFRITNAITRDQFKTLVAAIDREYYSVIEEPTNSSSGLVVIPE